MLADANQPVAGPRRTLSDAVAECSVVAGLIALFLVVAFGRESAAPFAVLVAYLIALGVSALSGGVSLLLNLTLRSSVGGRRSRLGKSVGGLLMCAGATWLGVVDAAYLRNLAGRQRCPSNLRQIGQAVLLYSIDHDGACPADVEGLLAEDLTTGVFVCPQSGDTAAARGPTTRATAADVTAPGHCSYVYLGKDWMDDELTADVVLAYEPISNHSGAGMNVLFGDGHVEFVQTPGAAALLAELKAGHNPPPASVR